MPPNRHEQKRRATKEALRAAAVRRFEEDGFDNTSVADIAADVGVTERTFYRHYPTKEAALFLDFDRRLEWLAAALELRPATESLVDSARHAVTSFPEDLELVRQVALLRSNLISRERAADHMNVLVASFAREIREHALRRYADRPDADFYATIAANVLAGALVGSVDVWGQRGCHDDIESMVDQAIELVRTGLDLQVLERSSPSA